MDNPINVSFGMEFEMIVLYEAKNYEAELKAGEGVHWQSCREPIGLREKMLILIRIEMIQILTDHGIPTNQWGRAEDFTNWTVEHDGTISREEDGVQDWCAIELKTPAFFFSPWSLDQVKKALSIVEKDFTAVVNESCGLHIHVGNCHEGYPLRTLKNFAMLITSFERQFSSLHPFHRINNHFMRPVSECFPPQTMMSSSVWEKLLVIESCGTLEQLIQQFNYDNNKWTAYSFLTLLNPFLRTIEFRQHSGTLDIEAITHWAKLSINLIQLAHSASHSDFYNIIKKSHALLDDDVNKYNIINLLHDLNLPELADYYSKPPRIVYNHPVWGSKEWEFQPEEESSSSSSSRQSDGTPAELLPPTSAAAAEYHEDGQDFLWRQDESTSWRGASDYSAASASIELSSDWTNRRNPDQRKVEVW